MRGWFDALVSVLLAPACAACRHPLAHPSRGCVCGACWQGVERFPPPLCEWCGDPLGIPGPDGSHRHPADCELRTRASAITRAAAVGPHTGALRSIIHAFKYDGRRSVACGLAALMREAGAQLLEDADACVPVPLHPSRLRSRGFNQADDLARHLRLPVIHAIRRVHHTDPQAGLAAQERRTNVAGAFAPTAAARAIRASTVVLVDDVRTTGATAECCAQVLKACGVRDVRVLTAARVASSSL